MLSESGPFNIHDLARALVAAGDDYFESRHSEWNDPSGGWKPMEWEPVYDWARRMLER